MAGGSRTPRPRVICPSCSNLHEQTGSTLVCNACLRRDDDAAARQDLIGARAGVRARGDLAAAMREPDGPFARGFRRSLFAPEGPFAAGADAFFGAIREFYAERLALLEARAARAYADGREAGLAEAQAEREEAA